MINLFFKSIFGRGSFKKEKAMSRRQYLQGFIGQELIADTRLHPTGFVRTSSGEILDAITDYGVIEEGEKVIVVDTCLGLGIRVTKKLTPTNTIWNKG